MSHLSDGAFVVQMKRITANLFASKHSAGMFRISRNRLAIAVLVAVVISVSLVGMRQMGVWSAPTVSDVLYSARTPLSEIVIVAIDDRSLQSIGRWPWDRAVFAELIDGPLSSAKVIGVDVSFFEPSASDDALEQAISGKPVVLASEYSEFKIVGGEAQGSVLLKPVVASEYGHVNLFIDSDGVARSLPPRINGYGVPSTEAFAMKIADEYLGSNVAVPDSGRMLINFFGRPLTFERISLVDARNAIPLMFRDKIVLIGATSADLHDEQLTPISKDRMPGVEIQANTIQTLVTGRFLSYLDPLWLACIVLLFSFVTSLALYRFRLWLGTAIAVALFIAYLAVSVELFERGIIADLLYPFLAIILTYIATTAIFYTTESAQRRRVSVLFGRYVSPDVADEILKQTDARGLIKSSKRTISVLFADIRGFTSMSEKLKPQQVVDMLNAYLGSMSEIVFEYKGTVDKYIGDCIMAIWNAPLDQADHAVLAVRAALAMQQAAEAVGKKLGAKLAYGIGINSGEAVVGNIGGARRLDYTVIGDTVNLASRLCGAAEGGKVLIGPNTHELIKDKVNVRKLAKMKFKGKRSAVQVYEALP